MLQRHDLDSAIRDAINQTVRAFKEFAQVGIGEFRKPAASQWWLGQMA